MRSLRIAIAAGVSYSEDLSRRAILITGGNGALGCAIARAFVGESDARIYLGVRKNRENAEKLAAESGEACSCLELDVTSPEDWKRAVETIVREQGGLHVLVNNAGRHTDGLLGTMPEQDWQDVIRTNLDSAFYGCKAAVPQMMAQRTGRIINISSLSALMAPAGQANYAAAKAGLLALTRSLAKEVARANVTVNAVCPGFIETEALQSLAPAEKQEAARRVPMRRFGRPEEVAAAVRFLACPEASYITGSVIKIDGGIL